MCELIERYWQCRYCSRRLATDALADKHLADPCWQFIVYINLKIFFTVLIPHRLDRIKQGFKYLYEATFL